MSWLSKFGHAFKLIFAGAVKVEKAVEPMVEAIIPATIPLFNVFDEGVEIAKDVEAAFAAAGVVQGGDAKLAAALPGFGMALDSYTKAKFPGSDEILKTEAYLVSKKALMNALVLYLNSLPETVSTAPTRNSVIVATAAAAAVKAAG